MATIRILISYSEGPTFGDPLPNINYEFKIVNLSSYSQFDLYKLIREYKPDIIYSIAPGNHGILNILNFEWCKRWSHLDSFDQITDIMIEQCFMYSSMPNSKDEIVPLISVVSTAYKSGTRILRPYNSLIAQTYKNWEWIIYDDSEDNNDTWNRLNELYEKDYRIKLIRSNKNDGSIGSVKFKVSMMAKGKYMVELDHDDDIHPDVLQWIVDAGKLYPDAGFLYTYTCPVYEETGESLIYGEYVGFGYCGYEAVKMNERWIYCLSVGKLNPMTIHHLIGLPNHLRVFKTDIYRKIGGNNSRFPVSDDYEVMIKAFLETKFVCIPEPGYTQYHNIGGNNFTYLRNSLIQLLVRYAYNYYAPQIRDRFLSLGVEKGPYKGKIWEDVAETHYPSLEYTYFPNIDKCISIILSLAPKLNEENTKCLKLTEFVEINTDGPNGLIEDNNSDNDESNEISEDNKDNDIIGEGPIYINDENDENDLKMKIEKIIKTLLSQKYKIWRLHISGSGVKELSKIMNELKDICDERIRWWNMSQNSINTELTAKNYGLKIMARSKYVSYINLNDKWNDNKLDEMISNINDKEYYLDKDNTLIHINNDKFAYWLPNESIDKFIIRCTN